MTDPAGPPAPHGSGRPQPVPGQPGHHEPGSSAPIPESPAAQNPMAPMTPVPMAPPRTVRPAHRTPSTLVAVAAVTLLLGVIAGAVWAVVTPAMSGVRAADGASVSGAQLGEEFAGVAAFCLIMCAFGAIAAGVSWSAARGWRGLPGYGVTLASTIVGTGVAGWVGTQIADWHLAGPTDVAVGQTFRVVPDLWLDQSVRQGPSGPWVLLICAPLFATLVYLVCALAQRDGDLGVGDQPQWPAVGDTQAVTSGV
ncbi:DUF2567 domain-containing protein [Gordonia desulfuricans]|uniref:DUF2567 domain-containing protein n=1 Tax=Gordonia desulfuricans TaxID=89051 RepID=UPI000AEB9482|nr:DUF2567 domain-containing protein [Gordonia desulfuricans]